MVATTRHVETKQARQGRFDGEQHEEHRGTEGPQQTRPTHKTASARTKTPSGRKGKRKIQAATIDGLESAPDSKEVNEQFTTNEDYRFDDAARRNRRKTTFSDFNDEEDLYLDEEEV